MPTALPIRRTILLLTACGCMLFACVDALAQQVDISVTPGGSVRVTAKKAANPTTPPAVEAPTVELGTAAAPTVSPPSASTSLPYEHHPWARFSPGAWRTLRTVTEAFDDAQRLISRTETVKTQSLVAVAGQTYSVETVTEAVVAGKKLQGTPQTATYSLLSDETFPVTSITELETASVSLTGQVIPCKRWRVLLDKPGGPLAETVYYAPDYSPYVLRREWSRPQGDAPASTTPPTPVEADRAELDRVEMVIRLNSPIAISGSTSVTRPSTTELVNSNHVLVHSHRGEESIERFEVRCLEVPGGLISASQTETDAAGNRKRWSTVELIEYGTEPVAEVPRDRPLLRLFRRRHRSVPLP